MIFGRQGLDRLVFFVGRPSLDKGARVKEIFLPILFGTSALVFATACKFPKAFVTGMCKITLRYDRRAANEQANSRTVRKTSVAFLVALASKF